MDAQEFKLFHRRWSVSFENNTSTRRDPEGDTSWYSLRSATPLSLPNGRKIVLKERHRLLWHALLVRAYDLSVTPTTTLVGRENLSIETGMSADTIGDILRELELLGWLRKKSRRNTSNVTYIFLTPLPLDADLPSPQPVSVAEEDIAAYVCGSSLRIDRIDRNATTEQFEFLGGMFYTALPDHPYFRVLGAEKLILRSLAKCVKIAGSVRRCYEVLEYVMNPDNPRSAFIFQSLREAKSLPTFIDLMFPTWFSMYPLILSDLPLDANPYKKEPNQ